jgi:regulator of replication initiation timing
MPPHSSHLLQPLDVGCFNLLKKAYGREIEHLIRCSMTHVSKTEFFSAFYAAFQATMTEKNIKSAFRGAGLVPLDPESVVSKLDVRLRTPTPAEEVASPSTPWVSKTPKTVLEAQFQCEYLDRRIRRHQSSSPESILGALKSLAKGTKAIMHENALLRAENQDLRQANEILSRRRNMKKTRLQKRGVMTVEEGRQAIDQMNVDGQAVEESLRSGSQGRSVQAKERHCGACGKMGHNARTCQIVVSVSEEEYSS